MVKTLHNISKGRGLNPNTSFIHLKKMNF